MSTIQIILIIVAGIALLVLGIYKGYAWLILFGLGVVVFGLYKSYQKTMAFNDELNQKLVTPYFTLISEGKTEEAYQKFTTDAYKAKYILADYQANYQRLEKEKGKPNQWKVVNIQEISNVMDGSSFLRMQVDCYFGEYFINIALDLTIDAQGNYKINDFFMKNLIGGYPGPW